jgi:hypothetical protein
LDGWLIDLDGIFTYVNVGGGMDFTQYVFGIVDAREDVREDGGEVWCGVETGEAAGFFFSGLD